MKLRKYIKNNRILYTLKNKVDNKVTEEAHYKFVKIRNPPKDIR